MLENLSVASLARHAGFTVEPGSSADVVSMRMVLNPQNLEKS
jgi:hypothetical protein